MTTRDSYLHAEDLRTPAYEAMQAVSAYADGSCHETDVMEAVLRLFKAGHEWFGENTNTEGETVCPPHELDYVFRLCAKCGQMKSNMEVEA